MNDQAKTMRERECLRNIKLCTGYLALEGHTCCRFGKPKCIFAHKLRELSVPDDTPAGQWSKTWNLGEVDFNVWPNDWQSKDAKRRFERAFHCEAAFHPADIPNWCWGLALHYKMIEDKDIPNDLRTLIPSDYDWPVLRRAYTRGKDNGSAKLVVDDVLTLIMRQRSGLDTELNADDVLSLRMRQRSGWSHFATAPKTMFFHGTLPKLSLQIQMCLRKKYSLAWPQVRPQAPLRVHPVSLRCVLKHLRMHLQRTHLRLTGE